MSEGWPSTDYHQRYSDSEGSIKCRLLSVSIYTPDLTQSAEHPVRRVSTSSTLADARRNSESDLTKRLSDMKTHNVRARRREASAISQGRPVSNGSSSEKLVDAQCACNAATDASVPEDPNSIQVHDVSDHEDAERHGHSHDPHFDPGSHSTVSHLFERW